MTSKRQLILCRTNHAQGVDIVRAGVDHAGRGGVDVHDHEPSVGQEKDFARLVKELDDMLEKDGIAHEYPLSRRQIHTFKKN